MPGPPAMRWSCRSAVAGGSRAQGRGAGGVVPSGSGGWPGAFRPGLRVVGVQPSPSPPMYAYLESNSTKPMPIAPTLADGVAGNIERDTIPWKMCRQLVDEGVLVDEEQIADATRWGI